MKQGTWILLFWLYPLYIPAITGCIGILHWPQSQQRQIPWYISIIGLTYALIDISLLSSPQWNRWIYSLGAAGGFPVSVSIYKQHPLIHAWACIHQYKVHMPLLPREQSIILTIALLNPGSAVIQSGKDTEIQRPEAIPALILHGISPP